MSNTNDNNKTILGNIGNIGFDINLTALSATYLCVALVIPILVFYILKKKQL